MTNATEAADMTINSDIVGRIGEHELGLGGFEQLSVGGLVNYCRSAPLDLSLSTGESGDGAS